jgi:hypothetical protein
MCIIPVKTTRFFLSPSFWHQPNESHFSLYWYRRPYAPYLNGNSRLICPLLSQRRSSEHLSERVICISIDTAVRVL